mmetsp:Transcript_11003/g.23072  ORF Transcript_11003/g.23072 Transcript_11003/m.23072 type:complete len:299 (+) Transcript_11003:96-992(+)
MNPIVSLVTMDFPYATETVCFFMAVQGSMTVRSGPNKNKSMPWFHALSKSITAGYSGALFTNMFMGRPTAMLSNDIFFGACLLGFLAVNCLPADIGYLFFRSFPGELLHTVFSQVFRISGVVGFSDAAFRAFRENPSPYYPIPVFGPILLPALLGNMGGFFANGFDGYLEGGMPWLFQQAISSSAFYHFYAHDEGGVVGVTLRSAMRPAAVRIMTALGGDEKEREDDVLFAKVMVGVFMLSMAVLRMNELLGPKFSPFEIAKKSMTFGKKKSKAIKPANAGGSSSSSSKNKKNKKKNQ